MINGQWTIVNSWENLKEGGWCNGKNFGRCARGIIGTLQLRSKEGMSEGYEFFWFFFNRARSKKGEDMGGGGKKK